MSNTSPSGDNNATLLTIMLGTPSGEVLRKLNKFNDSAKLLKLSSIALTDSAGTSFPAATMLPTLPNKDETLSRGPNHRNKSNSIGIDMSAI